MTRSPCPLVGPEWSQIFAVAGQRFSLRVMREARAFTVARSRYAEDRFPRRSFPLCVLLGAGLDSFGWRRPDLLSSARLIEVDHPGMQKWKRDRAAAMGLPIHDHHVFAPVDSSGTICPTVCTLRASSAQYRPCSRG